VGAKFRVSGAALSRAFAQRGNSRCLLNRLLLTRSPADSGAALFFGAEAFHSRGDFFVFLDFPAVYIGQSSFDLAAEPLVLADKPLHRLAHQRRGVARLLGGHSIKFHLKLSR
jgi:hypothetical protein